MKTLGSSKPFRTITPSSTRLSVALLAWMALSIAGAFLAHGQPQTVPLTINVVGVAPNGTPVAPPTGYRWTVEEDVTKLSIPGRPATSSNYSLSFHTSYMPVVAAGRAGDAAVPPPTQDPDVLRVYNQTLPSLDPSRRYYVSVAAEGFQMGGAPVVFSGATATATVYLNQYPLPTAQISIFAFNDNSPINGAPDLPQELGLAGFTVQLLEAGGTYGASGGQVTQDAFGNPLGTTYNADGSVQVRGSGIITTGPDGVATIKNLYPAKYTILLVPPTGSDWHQTSTIEGTRGIDAWVKNNEPSFFQEFGPPGHHVFVGFTRSGFLATNASGAPLLNGSSKVSGRIVNNHTSRPPVYTFSGADPVPECWVGLNQPNGGRALYATRCNKDSSFEIPNVPPGMYELAVWDEPLDVIIAATTITVGATDLALGNVPVFRWFGRYQGRVFQDIDGTGLPFFRQAFNKPHIEVDPVTGLETEVIKNYAAGDLKPPFGEGVASNLRFRDGSLYQATTTKKDGTFAFTEVFPFFNWLVAEIDYARFKATAATVVVDQGGPVDPAGNRGKLWNAAPGLFGSNDPALAADPWTRLNPQLQRSCTAADVAANTDANGQVIDSGACVAVGDEYFRTEAVGDGPGAVILEGMQLFLGQTNHIEWGKSPYKPTENGGIAGMVNYGITRAEDDPRFATPENWEPGVPRVQMGLYLDCDADTKIDKPRNDGSGLCVEGAAGLSSLGYQADLPDVDNYPFCWRDPASCGIQPDINGNLIGVRGAEDVKRSRTGDASTFSYGDVFQWGNNSGSGAQLAIGLGKTDSWDDAIPTGCLDPTPYTVPSTGEQLDCFDGLRNFNQVRPAVYDGGYAFGRAAGQPELPMIIGATGEGRYIVEAVAPPGYLHQGNGDKNVAFGDTLKATPAALPFECVGMELDVPPFLTLFPGEPNPNYGSAQYPNNKWRKCDMKAVALVPGTNPAPGFHMYTEAPVASHAVGFILDDTAAEFNRFSPTFGEKHSPPHLPISIQDWTGRELSRVYSDEFGSYNFLAPSTFTLNPPYPSGVMPNMLVACMNHPGPVADPTDPTRKVIDPFFNRAYTQFCYTFQYLTGKTTYLDTPVLPIAAFAAVNKDPLDCECADGTPAVYSATHGDNGPWVPGPGSALTIVSVGRMDVMNPAYDPAITDPADPRSRKLIARDYGFGTTPGSVTLNGLPLTNVTWSDGVITGTVPADASTGQLMIRRGDNGKESVVGLTVHVGGAAPKRVNLAGADGAFKTIQEAMDAALPGELITVAPGTYNEYVIMDRRVRLQGWGAGSTFINAAKSSPEGLATWRNRVSAKANVTFTLLPGQELGANAPNNEPLLFGAEEGAGVLVVGRAGPNNGCLGTQSLRVDGLTITGSDAGGGILASGYACGLQVSNNRVVSNYGTYGGGIRIGHTTLVGPDNDYTDGVNRTVAVHHNWISQNGATGAGGGGGLTLGKGSDSYLVTDNYICGNFSMADGGGISHLGRSGGSVNSAAAPASRIAGNKILFNQTFNQSADPMGGGLAIGGQIPLVGQIAEGSGDVVVEANQIQGNQAGAGAGGGISVARTIAGNDVRLVNNMIVNNVAAYAGGGVALSSTVTSNGAGVRLVNNTIAANASTATNRQSFGPQGPLAPSLPQVAGLAVLSGSSPTLLNNILWGNRSYIYLISGTTSGLFNPGTTDVNTPAPDAVYKDLGRLAGTAALVPRYSVLTATAENASYDSGLTDCSNTTPTSGSFYCNRLEPVQSTTLFVKAGDFLSIVDPLQPVVLPETTVTLTPVLTFDEGGNFVNVIFSPLTLWDTTAGPNFGAPRTDYHIADTSVARDSGRARSLAGGAFNANLGARHVPLTDFEADTRGSAVDIGADEIPVPADLSVSKTDGLTYVTRGTTGVSYTIVVSNTGANPVTDATLSDVLPGGTRLVVDSGGWSCLASAGASCTANASNSNATRTGVVSLPVGGTATFTLTGRVPLLAPLGASTNTVTVTVPAGMADTNPADNTAIDTDTITRVAPVSFTGESGAATLNAAGTLLNFGNRTGVFSSTVTLTVGGTESVTFGTASVANLVGIGFSLTADTCAGATHAPGASCAISVEFNGPSGSVGQSGTLSVPYSGPAGSPATLSLRGS